MNWLLVFFGGGLGCMARYAISAWLYKPSPTFPFATLIANCAACLILGYLLGRHSRQALATHHRYLLITGFCGGFSTFSTFSAEALQLWQDQQQTLAITYVAASIVLGLACVGAGLALAKHP